MFHFAPPFSKFVVILRRPWSAHSCQQSLCDRSFGDGQKNCDKIHDGKYEGHSAQYQCCHHARCVIARLEIEPCRVLDHQYVQQPQNCPPFRIAFPVAHVATSIEDHLRSSFTLEVARLVPTAFRFAAPSITSC